jgi:hypothetical protein
MNTIKYILLVIIVLGITGCSNEYASNEESAPLGMMDESTAPGNAKDEQKPRTKYLAYVHHVRVILEQKEIPEVFEKLVSFCNEDEVNKCTLLHSRLNTGDYSYGKIQVRILPGGVDSLLKVASRGGEISERATNVQDLQDAIVNNQKRLEMLTQYHNRLTQLEKEPSHNIETLIKLAQELSRVQSDIEYAEGRKAKLLQQTQMDIVDIALDTPSYVSFWTPISESFSGFGENLSESIAQAITALAYLLPWIFILMILFVAWRMIRHKMRVKRQSIKDR